MLHASRSIDSVTIHLRQATYTKSLFILHLKVMEGKQAATLVWQGESPAGTVRYITLRRSGDEHLLIVC